MAGQVKGDFEAREENMKKYLQNMKDLVLKFSNFDIQQIPRPENSRANLLSKLAMMSFSNSLSQRTFFETLKKPNVEDPIQVLQVDDEPCLMAL